MLLLLYCLPLLFRVCQRSGSYCGCYILYQYCFRFNRGKSHVVVILSTITVYRLTEQWFKLWLLYCFPLLFKVWKKSGSCCCCCNVYHYCLRFDRGAVHDVGVILSIITVYGLTEEWYMLLLYCLPLLFNVWQRRGSCCGSYIVYHYSLRFVRGVVRVVVILSTINVYGLTEEWFMLLLLYWLSLFFKVWQRSGSCCGCYIVYQHC